MARWIVVAALTLAFAMMVGVRPGGGLYSPDVRYRLQTGAMLRGTLALQPVPHGQRADWAWGNGSQQVWGIGVPLLRMPGELVARVLGWPAFPDRITLVAFFALVMIVAVRSVPGTVTTSRSIVAGLVAATIGLMPAFVALSRTRLFVYEEAVVYGYLWAALQVALVVGVAGGAPRSWSFAAAAVAGAGALIRPTLFLYGVVTIAIVVGVQLRGRVRRTTTVTTIASFLSGIALTLWTNALRFGYPLEFGQRVNVSRWIPDQFAKNFDYPFAHEPLFSASRELIAALVGIGIRFNGVDFYGSGAAMHAWFSSTIRFREFYASSGATWIFMALAIGGWMLVAVRLARQRARALDDPAGAVLLWSLLTFSSMAIFYVRMPTMTTRYAVDFAAAVAAAVIGIVMTVAAKRPARLVPLAVVLGASWLYGLATVSVSPTHAAQPLVGWAQLAQTMPAPVTTGPALPSRYACGDRIDELGVPFNGIGWNWAADCGLAAGSTLFFSMPPEAQCLELDLANADAGKEASIEIALGSVRLDRVAPNVFCAPAGYRRNPAGVEIASFKWIPAAELSVSRRPGFGLRAVRAIQRP
ncbi:MAG: hypothetical protein ABI665_10625 [Vicinamibacterales bacterium]